MNSDSLNGIICFTNCSLLREDGSLDKKDLWVDQVTGVILDSQDTFYIRKERPGQTVDLNGNILSPGLIDIQINGAYGFDFSAVQDDDARYAEGLKMVAERIVETGVTSVRPLFYPRSASLLGWHAEGPFIDASKRGAHSPAFLATAPEGWKSIETTYGASNVADHSTWSTNEPAGVRIITAAPEVPGLLDAIPELVKRGIVFSMGHSIAPSNVAMDAVQRGTRLITHLFNAMPQLHHRDPSIIGLLGAPSKAKFSHIEKTTSAPTRSEALEPSQSTPGTPGVSNIAEPTRFHRPFYSLIADGVHLHPHSVKATLHILDPNLQDGVHEWHHGKRLFKDGDKLYVDGTTTLAGSCVTLDKCVRNLASFTEISIGEALKCATFNPAKCLGIEHKKGTLRPGADADLVVLDTNGIPQTLDPNPPKDFQAEVSKWSHEIRQNLDAMNKGERVLENLLNAPRRRHADPTSVSMAHEIAQNLHPSAAQDSLAPIIQYERDIVKLRAYIQEQRKADIEAATARRAAKDWRKRIIQQGPWDEVNDPLSLGGASSLPMPVQIGTKEDFAPFFSHLRLGGDDSLLDGEDGEIGVEPYYDIHMIEFDRGVLYADRRMDLCKMVVGPTHIGDLMDSLETNPFTQHFLLGNNIIGPLGAKRIARFIDEYPNRMTTWYLAGNCIDGESFAILANSLVKSTSVTNAWLKRNPLGPSSADSIFRLITQTQNLRTLDLDQTSIGDVGVARLFSLLADYTPASPPAIRHLYLNACGISANGAEQIARYLASDACTLTSLYISHNPLGDGGAKALSTGLKVNRTLERLALSSGGLKDEGTIKLLSSLSSHPTLRSLDIGQGYATEDLGMRFNWLTESIASLLVTLIQSVPTLRSLVLDYTPMSRQGLNQIVNAALDSKLLYFFAKHIHPQGSDYISVKDGQEGARLSRMLKARLEENVAKEFNGMNYQDFIAEEKRWLVSPEDVRYIDSVYRNRDAGMARRGLKILDKLWDDDDNTLEMVQNASA
ncbi:hypothetical protein VNI00_011614 [Paramarasmius palmivorus]|uniref:Amidohydrolase-related domain-containing protein n=1 Tax=Paramarasmius palmivorus TaxID=297713 RepID=A0AAW0CA05_9AGAR